MSSKRMSLFVALAFLLPAAGLLAAPASATIHHKVKHHVVHKVSTHHRVVHKKKIVHHTSS